MSDKFYFYGQVILKILQIINRVLIRIFNTILDKGNNILVAEILYLRPVVLVLHKFNEIVNITLFIFKFYLFVPTMPASMEIKNFLVLKIILKRSMS